MLFGESGPMLYNKLQIVCTIDTERNFRMRCLPEMMNKKFINRKILLGGEHPYIFGEDGSIQVENEFFLSKHIVCLYERQIQELCNLFMADGEHQTFKEVNRHIGNLKYQLLQGGNIKSHVQTMKIIDRYINEAFFTLVKTIDQENHDLTLFETLSGHTLKILGYNGEKNMLLN